MQPIRFYKFGSTPDYQNYFPNFDNIYPGQTWFEGNYVTKYHTDWIINKTISIQFFITVEGTEDLDLYKYNSVTDTYELLTSIEPIAITPLGWEGFKCNKYDYTPTTEGVYYFKSTSAGWISDKFAVHSLLKFRKRLVEVDYYHYENNYGLVFFDNTVPRYTPKAFFTGKLIPGSSNEISAFEDEYSVELLRATPRNTPTLKLTDIHISQLTRINLIFSCSNLTINGITYQNKEGIESEPGSDTDLMNITVKLTQSNYQYYQQ